MATPNDPRRPKYGLYVPHEREEYEPGGVSMTRQEFADECDVNALMSRYEKAGHSWPPPANDAPPRYLDLTEVPDFASAMQLLRDAEQAFMSLPARIRAEFDNDPEQFVAYAEDPANRKILQEWGLAEPDKPVEPPMRVEVVNDSPAPEPAQAGSKPTQ